MHPSLNPLQVTHVHCTAALGGGGAAATALWLRGQPDGCARIWA
jgi:hypothetical protein